MSGATIPWAERREKKAFLALADGTVIRGWSGGAGADRLGEVVFNTGMTGYEEILTDPSYAGQIVVLTMPEIGNTGFNREDHESAAIHASGLIFNGAGLLFVGHSGAGKSTMVKLLRDESKILCDDRIIVRRARVGKTAGSDEGDGRCRSVLPKTTNPAVGPGSRRGVETSPKARSQKR